LIDEHSNNANRSTAMYDKPNPACPPSGERTRLKPILATLLLLFALALSNCGASPQESQALLVEREDQAAAQSAPTGQPKTIALVMKTLTNPFFVEMEKGARRAEQEFGIRLIVKTAAQETSIEQQIAIVEGLIQAKVDAIVIAPGDSAGLLPVLKQAQDAGIVIVNIDNRLDPALSAKLGLRNIPFISVDNEQAAYRSARFIGDQIKAPTKAAIIEGIRTARNAEDRKNGALRAFQENEQITIVAMETAHWKIDEAYDVTKQLFARHPDIGALFAANDMMALGAVKYLQESGRTNVFVAGFDALEEATPALRAGTLAVTIDQRAAEQGYTGVQYAVKALAGDTLPAETMIDVHIVSGATVR
jgi:ribose transport system substrate-binding protein